MCLKNILSSVVASLAIITASPSFAQEKPAEAVPVSAPKVEESVTKDVPWYERLHVRGYTQFRYNRAYASNDLLKNDLGDKTLGENNGFSIRRARLVVQGDIVSFLSIYLQPDFAGALAGETLHVAAMRDWYADVFVDPKKELRFRVGQSKVPYGFENMQSSQNRAPIDRTDAINSAVPGERDMGIFVYWAPDSVRKRFKHLVESGLKGSGDYGVAALGVYNGQGVNARERNDNRHVVGRLAYPFVISDQVLELGVGGYAGKVNVTRAKDIGGVENCVDARVNANVVLYPKPVGFQAEFNVGKGPELLGNEVVGNRPLHGGYAMIMVRIGSFLPYVRAAIYDGGIKTVVNSPRHQSKELEMGLEMQVKKWLELTAAVDVAQRSIDGKDQRGSVGRLQLQFNY